MPRWQLACDACEVTAWIGPRSDGRIDAWCEADQRGQVIEAGAAPRCDACGGALALEAPRFVELYGALQHLHAVLAAWGGDPAPLATLLPERPIWLTDLDPPAAAANAPAALVAALERLAAGAFADARARLDACVATLSGPDAAAGWRALGVAAERGGDVASAERAFGRAIDAGAGARARLARGALRARRGDWDGAREDLAHAGEGREARWNRAAVRIAAAMADGDLDRATLDAARAEAGAPSAYWSDHTVGRLLWGLLLERAVAGRTDADALRAAERELEFDTFWDRALVLAGFARIGSAADAARIARPLALELLAALEREPCLRGAAAREVASACAAAGDAVRADDPSAARAAVEAAWTLPWLRRYRLPCASCGRGTIGVEGVEDGAEGDS